MASAGDHISAEYAEIAEPEATARAQASRTRAQRAAAMLRRLERVFVVTSVEPD